MRQKRRGDRTMDRVVGAEAVRTSEGHVLLVPLVKGHSTTTLISSAAGVESYGYSEAPSVGRLSIGWARIADRWPESNANSRGAQRVHLARREGGELAPSCC